MPQRSVPPLSPEPEPEPTPAQSIDDSATESIEDIIAAANAEPTPVPPAQAPAPSSFGASFPAARGFEPRNAGTGDTRPMGRPVPKLAPSNRPQPQARIPLGAPSPATPSAPAGPSFSPRTEAPQPSASSPRAAFSRMQPAQQPGVATSFSTDTPASPSAPRNLPPIVARAEAAKGRAGANAFGAAMQNPVNGARREPIGPRLDGPDLSGSARAAEDFTSMFAQTEVPKAMSSVREVEAEPPADPQNTIDRAIATLDREARGGLSDRLDRDDADGLEGFGPLPGDDRSGYGPSRPDARAETGPGRSRRGRNARVEREARPLRPRAKARGKGVDFVPVRGRDDSGLGAMSIFLIVFGVLLVGAAGLGVWAWREGFLDLSHMFSAATETTEVAATVDAAPGTAEEPATGPGNTDTPVAETTPKAELASDGSAERLGAADAAVQPATALETPTSEERLGADATGATTEAALAANPSATAGSQSLLLEANDAGKSGAVPFSGAVEWSEGTDEMGVPTLVGKASIPARNLTVEMLIRKNSDPSLPASHLMEVNFKVNESFVGGSIAGLPGVLLKNEELVQGTPLVGASARVVGNSFLFALSASPDDMKVNADLLTTRKWIDLALIYATGKRAIITLEKDEAAMKLFASVIKTWNETPQAAAVPAKS